MAVMCKNAQSPLCIKLFTIITSVSGYLEIVVLAVPVDSPFLLVSWS